MMCVESLFPPLMIILTRKKNRCIMILTVTASRGLPSHGHRLDNTAHVYYIQKKNKSGGNATGVTGGPGIPALLRMGLRRVGKTRRVMVSVSGVVHLFLEMKKVGWVMMSRSSVLVPV